MVKLLSDPSFKCLCHLVKRQLLIPFYSFTINSIHCKLCLLNHCHLPLLSWHGTVEYTHMNQCKIGV